MFEITVASAPLPGISTSSSPVAAVAVFQIGYFTVAAIPVVSSLFSGFCSAVCLDLLLDELQLLGLKELLGDALGTTLGTQQ